MTQSQERPVEVIERLNAEFMPPLQAASAALFRAQCIEQDFRNSEPPEPYVRATSDRVQIKANLLRAEALNVHMPALLAGVRNVIAQTEPGSEERSRIVKTFLEQLVLMRAEFVTNGSPREIPSAEMLMSLPSSAAESLTDDIFIGDLSIFGPTEMPTDYSDRFADVPREMAFSGTIQTRALTTLLGREGQVPEWIAERLPAEVSDSELAKVLPEAAKRGLHLLLYGMRIPCVGVGDAKDIPCVLQDHPTNRTWLRNAETKLGGNDWQARLATLLKQVLASLQ